MSSTDKGGEQFFKLQPNNRWISEDLIAIVRDLLRRPHITPLEVQLCAALLHSLHRLPRITPEVTLEVSLEQKHDEEGNRDWYSLLIDDERLELESAQVSYTPSIGSDLESRTHLLVTADVCNAEYVSTWFREFATRAKDEAFELTIRDNGESNLDLSGIEEYPDCWDSLPESEEDVDE